MKTRGSLFFGVSGLLLAVIVALPVQADPEKNDQSVKESSWRDGAKRVIEWLVDEQPETNAVTTVNVELKADQEPKAQAVEPALPIVQGPNGNQWKYEAVSQLSPIYTDNTPPLQTILPLLAVPNQPVQEVPDIDDKQLIDDCDPALSGCEGGEPVTPIVVLSDIPQQKPSNTKIPPPVIATASPITSVSAPASGLLMFVGVLLLAGRRRRH
ncbi:hypothetical protein [Zooshikella harenae]|uniref:GlyGly-CTERM sorting domain-containing protein n=1 Tax=Zooshikella harenae TaxID=2827238 RepID=A0ABS5ZGQ1_9GAMM|nr:hypothetical protein [Zooshikella harenae]MBU2712167.1 hypothetical protein [Zooshikella harenae]